MAVYDLEEQEQLSELKLFWKQYGRLITAALAGAVVVLLAWQGWNWRQQSRANEANAIYGQLLEAASANDFAKMKAATETLINDYPQQTQAALAGLVAARAAIVSKDVASAKNFLTFVADRTREPGLRDIANLRLAAILLDEKNYTEALSRLSREPAAEYLPRQLDLKGDVLAASGKLKEARAAWKEALAKIEAQNKAEPNNKRHLGLGDIIDAKMSTSESAK